MADVSSEPTFKSTRQPLPERPSDPHSIFLLKWGREPKSNSSLIFRVWNESRYTYISPRDAKENQSRLFEAPSQTHVIVELDLLAYLLPLHHQMLQFASDLDIHVQFTVIIPGIYLTVKQLLYFYSFESASKALHNACICFHLQLQKRTNMCSVRYQCA